MRRGAQGRAQAGAMQAVWQGMHSRTSGGSAHGFFGGIVRSVLQLRTPQGNGQSELAGVKPEAAVQKAAPAIRFRDPQIEMAHGAGGKASRRLVEGLFVPLLCDAAGPLSDAALVDCGAAQVAITTDSFVVKPLTFPGGSIGELAINGTVNDLAVSGAVPQAIVVGFVLEAGLPTATLEAEIRAMAEACGKAGVRVIGGDTKVVENGKADKMYITTTGIGQPLRGVVLDSRYVRPGDKVLLSGPI